MNSLNLWNLPEDMFCLILQYLDLRNHAKLDMAISDANLRPYYHSQLEKISFPMFYDPKNIANDNEIYRLPMLPFLPTAVPVSWLESRKIKFTEIDVINNLTTTLPIVLNSASILQYFRFSDYGVDLPEDYFARIGSCPSLREIQCKIVSAKYFGDFLSSNQQIQKLHVKTCDPLVVPLIAAHCPNLQSLSLAHNGWFNDESVTTLTSGALNLSSLNISFTAVERDESIHQILNSFTNLQYIEFIECRFSTQAMELCLKNIVRPLFQSNDESQLISAIHCVCRMEFQVPYAFL